MGAHAETAAPEWRQASADSTVQPMDLRAASERIDVLLRALEASPNPAVARTKADELVGLLVRLYGAGLERMLTIVYDEGGDAAARIFAALSKDDFVSSLMILHGLHTLTLEQRIEAALDRVRSYLHSHEGDVALLRVENGVVYLRMAGSCHGCPSSATTMKLAIERAIHEAAPEITDIRAEGVHDGPRITRKASEWVSLDDLPELDIAGLAEREIEGMPVLFLRHESVPYAYRNQCPRCFKSLRAARVDWPLLACASCGQTYDVVKAGRAPNMPGIHLEPFPLVADGQRVQLAVPVTS